MPKYKMPRFRSIREEREFWDSHDVFEVVGEEDWRPVQAGEVHVDSVYVSRVSRRGATLRVSRDLLARMGARPGSRVQVRVKGQTVVIESK